jgi:hypothetical protein
LPVVQKRQWLVAHCGMRANTSRWMVRAPFIDPRGTESHGMRPFLAADPVRDCRASGVDGIQMGDWRGGEGLRACFDRPGIRAPLAVAVRFAWGLALLAVAGCATLPGSKSDEAARIAAAARAVDVCAEGADCAGHSPLQQLARTQVPAAHHERPRPHVLLLADPQDALQARLALIRGARHTLDVQTYIYAEDDAGWMFLRELIGAAERGVRVRLLVDQISAMERVETLAALSAAHVNLEFRVYNPIRGRGPPTTRSMWPAACAGSARGCTARP